MGCKRRPWTSLARATAHWSSFGLRVALQPEALALASRRMMLSVSSWAWPLVLQ